MVTEDYSKSKKKVENQKLMMKISSTKNMSGGIGCVILLGGALITAAAMGSAFLISRKCRKSTDKITKKERNDKIEDESSNKGLHFVLPEYSSSPCIEQHQPSSNGTDKCLNDNDSTSLFSTSCLIQDEKPKLGMSDEKMDTLNAIVSDHPKGGGKSPSLDRLPVHEEELVLSDTKISLLPDPDQELDEVSEEAIQGNEITEVAHVHHAQATVSAVQVDNERELLVHNDKGESNELQHTGVIETDNLEEGLIQEQEKQASGDQETINPDGSLQETSNFNEHELLNPAFELMKAADEDEDKDHMLSTHFEEQCADAETQIDQVAKKCDVQIQFSDEKECAKENDQANSRYEEATSENGPCRTYSIVVPNLAASRIISASTDDEHYAEAYEDEDKGHMYFEKQCADAETKIDQISKECNIKMQFSDQQVCSNKNDQENSCHEEATLENSHCRTYSMDVQSLGASETRNASVDDQHSAEVIQVIKETNAMDPAASGEQIPEADYSPIQLVEKQSFEQNCQGNVLKEDNEASKSLSVDIEVVDKDLEAHIKEVKDEVEESVFVYEEEDDDDNDVDKDDATQEVEDDILEGSRNSSEKSSSEKIWPADSNQDLLLELREQKVKEEEEGKNIEEETCSVENCNLKSTQNDVAITSCQQSSNGKDDSTVNVIDSYRTKLMYLNDIAAITRGRRVLLGALLVLIWYFCLNAFFLPV